ncbi:MAG: ribosome silencing factor [Oscillospiraceae bacterium]|jgi:ribosome-associated protein
MAEISSFELTKEIYSALNDKLANNVKVLETREITILADYFIICSANSTTHIKTLADAVEKKSRELGEPPRHIEGYRSGGWVLVDLGCLIVHIFLEDVRAFYDLERLWKDAKAVEM